MMRTKKGRAMSGTDGMGIAVLAADNKKRNKERSTRRTKRKEVVVDWLWAKTTPKRTRTHGSL